MKTQLLALGLAGTAAAGGLAGLWSFSAALPVTAFAFGLFAGAEATARDDDDDPAGYEEHRRQLRAELREQEDAIVNEVRREAFAKARTTGKPVSIGGHKDGKTVVCTYAMPDGNTRTVRVTR